jgi:hypothetical protein
MDLDGWTGTLDQLCQSEMGRTYAQMLATVPNPDDHRFYSDIWLTQAVTGAEVINASTVLYSRLPFFVGGGPEPEPEPEPPVGSISGTITLTGIPATNKPTVTISALSPGSSIEDFFRPYGRDLVLSGSGTQTISWTIPLSQDDADKFGASPRTVEFMLYVAPEGMMDKGFYITLCTHTVNAATDDTVLGNIGTASVAYVILSGTLNISYNGQAVPQMFISAKASEGHYVGSAYIAGNSATSGIPWSMVIWPSFASPTTVSFEISHASVVDPDPFFNVPGLSPTTVYKTDVSGIHLNVGNITGD